MASSHVRGYTPPGELLERATGDILGNNLRAGDRPRHGRGISQHEEYAILQRRTQRLLLRSFQDGGIHRQHPSPRLAEEVDRHTWMAAVHPGEGANARRRG